jgi:tRNA-(ms[2]io[6]A)-hydroxylase
MKRSLELTEHTNPKWVEAVLGDFNTFLQDHADCERKASSMAMSFVARYPDRVEIIPGLIETALEELEHFRDVYAVLKKRGVQLSHEIKEDPYIKKLLELCRTGRNERFLDRLLLASIIECRGAERFRLVYEAIDDNELKDFYHRLWASEAKHGNIFVDMAMNYFKDDEIYKRLGELNQEEGKIVSSLPFKAALH